MSKIKIVYLFGRLGYGGAEKHLTLVLSYLDRNKYQPVVVCFQKVGVYVPEIEKLNVPIVELGIRRIYSCKGIRKLFWLSQFIKNNQIAILHSYLYGANFFGAVAAKMAGIPAISSVRNTSDFLTKGQLLLNKNANKLAAVVTAVSKEVKRKEIKHGIPADKIITIYNGVKVQENDSPINTINQKKIELGLKKDHTIIGTVAYMLPHKGHKYLLQAAVNVVESNPDVQFLLVGAGQLQEELEGLTEKLGLSGRIIFAGHRDDLPDMFSMMDIFVLPSLTEGMSNALLEAMAAGLPCVATKVGGNAEVVEDKVTGFVVPSGDSQALANKIITLLEDKELAKKMGQLGRERIKKQFSIESMLSQMDQLYDRVLLAKGKGVK